MVQVFDAGPDFSTELARVLTQAGANIGQGIATGGIKRRNALGTELQKIPGAQKYLNKEILSGGLNTLDPITRIGLDKRAEELLRAKRVSNASDAVNLAYQEYQQKLDEHQAKNPPKQSGNALFDLAFGGKSPEELKAQAGENLSGGLAKGVRPLAQLADMPGNLGRVLAQAGIDLYDLIAQTPSEKKEERRQRKEKNAEKLGIKSFTQRFDELTGNRGIPETAAQEIIAGYPLGASGIISKGAEIAAKNLGAPEWLQQATEFTTFLASEGLKLPGKLNGKLLTNAEKVATATGKTTQQIIGEAQQASKVNLQKIISGDTKEAVKLNNAISKELPKVSTKVKELPKNLFNKQAAVAEREAFGAKLPEQPLSEYFTPERPIPKKAEVIERIQPQIQTTEEALKNANNQIKEIESRARNATNAVEKQRWESIAKYQKGSVVGKLNEQLRDLRYELKYGVPRPSEAQLNAQVEKSIKELVNSAKNPSAENIEKINRQLSLDKKYLESADKILKNGEIPGEFRPDTFIQRKGKYLDAYESRIRDLKENLSKLKGEELEAQKRSIDYLQGRANRLKADIINQSNKLKVMDKLQPPSGAFYKQQLKDAFKDIQEFQKDFFKDLKGRVLKQDTLKTKSVTKSRLNELGKEIAKNPTKENLAKAYLEEKSSNATKQDVEEFFKKREKSLEKSQEAVKQTKLDFKEVAKDINKGPVPTKLFSNIVKRFNKIIFRGIPIGVGIGVLQALSEEYLGFKPNASILRAISLSQVLTSAGIGNYAYRSVRDIFEDAHVRKLQELRNNPSERSKYIQSLSKEYDKSKINRILKKEKEAH